MNFLTLQDLREQRENDLYLLVIGDPVEHSLSPPMHNAALDFLKLPYRYGRLRVAKQELRTAFEILRGSRFIGWNLTLPHKLAVLELLDGIDPAAEQLRAVNTVVHHSGKLFGFNTDGQGLARAVEEAFGCDLISMQVALLGAGGGAGQAAARYLARLGVPRLVLINRTMAKAERLAEELAAGSSGAVETGSWQDLSGICSKVDLIVNASSVGLNGEPVYDGLRSLEQRHLVFDMVYGRQETPLVRFAREKGAKAADGLLMLFHQGVLAFELWFGKPAPAAIMREALFVAAGRDSVY